MATSLRTQIGDALVTLLGSISTPTYNTNVVHCQRRLKFIDEVEEEDGYPSIYVTAASETREYLPSSRSNRHILFIIRGYVYDETDSDAALNNLMEDVEQAINTQFFTNRFGNLVNDIRIMEITSDEGLLSPEAVFEMIVDATIVECV